ncbi:MAG: SHOCT domain-containing protein [Thermodesulfobacteriota bacterium]
MHMFGDYGMGMGGGGMIFMALFWVVIIVGIIYLIKLLTDKGRSSAQMETAEEILKKRYAKGEISREEFEKIKKDLQA